MTPGPPRKLAHSEMEALPRTFWRCGVVVLVFRLIVNAGDQRVDAEVSDDNVAMVSGVKEMW